MPQAVQLWKVKCSVLLQMWNMERYLLWFEEKLY